MGLLQSNSKSVDTQFSVQRLDMGWNDLQSYSTFWYGSEDFSKINGTRIFNLSGETYHVHQGTLSIANFFGKLKMIYNELATANEYDCLYTTCLSSPKGLS